MPRVRVRVSHLNIGGETRHRGQECQVDGDVASYLTSSGFAEIVRGERPETPEDNARIEATKRTRTRSDK